jgi:hypothetical protein
VTDDSVEIAWVDQGYIGARAAEAAACHGIRREVVNRFFLLLAMFPQLLRSRSSPNGETRQRFCER